MTEAANLAIIYIELRTNHNVCVSSSNKD